MPCSGRPTPRSARLDARARSAAIQSTGAWAWAWALAVLGVLAAASPAQAWTRTEVAGMRAHAQLLPSGVARISLELDVEVQGGWVEHFELAELGRGVALDAGKPPTWVDGEGHKHLPAATLRNDGTLRLDFGERRTAPRRGRYTSRIVYELALPRDDRGALVLTLPAWPRALENVELWIDAPVGARVIMLEEETLDEVDVLERGALTIVHIRRPQLPHTRALQARIALQASHAVPASRAPDVAPYAHVLGKPASAAHAAAALLALLLIALKRAARTPLEGAAASKAAARTSSAYTLLIAAPSAVAVFASSAAPAALAVGLAMSVALGLALPTARATPSARRRLRYRPVHAIDAQRATRARMQAWLGPASSVDATTPGGFAVWAILGAVAFRVETDAITAHAGLWLEVWAVASPLWWAHTRLSAAPCPYAAMRQLSRVRAQVTALLKSHGARAAIEIGQHESCAPATDARLRIVSADDRALVFALAADRDGHTRLALRVSRATERSALLPVVDAVAEVERFLAPAKTADAGATPSSLPTSDLSRAA